MRGYFECLVDIFIQMELFLFRNFRVSILEKLVLKRFGNGINNFGDFFLVQLVECFLVIPKMTETRGANYVFFIEDIQSSLISVL